MNFHRGTLNLDGRGKLSMGDMSTCVPSTIEVLVLHEKAMIQVHLES